MDGTGAAAAAGRATATGAATVAASVVMRLNLPLSWLPWFPELKNPCCLFCNKTAAGAAGAAGAARAAGASRAAGAAGASTYWLNS